MPDYPTPPKSPAGLLPRPATGNPSLERAAQGLQKAYPQDMSGVDIQPDWGPLMYSNVQGWTTPSEPSTIHINAQHAAMGPQTYIEDTAAHELQHLRQFKTENPLSMSIQRMLAYDDRPYEHDAERAATDYSNDRPIGTHDTVISGLQGRALYDQGNLPAVKSIIDKINGK